MNNKNILENSYFIKYCINKGSMEIIDNEKGVKNCDN